MPVVEKSVLGGLITKLPEIHQPDQERSGSSKSRVMSGSMVNRRSAQMSGRRSASRITQSQGSGGDDKVKFTFVDYYNFIDVLIRKS